MLTLLLINYFCVKGQIKSNYTPFSYSADTTKTILLSEYQFDSLKYETLYYKDILEETKRSYLISQKTKYVDTVISNKDSVVINYLTSDRVLLLKRVLEYNNPNLKSYFLDEYYYLNEGKISYNTRIMVSEKNEIILRGNITEELGRIELLLYRFRYVYHLTGKLSKVVEDYRGDGMRLLEYTNDKEIETQDFRKFTHRKISIWKFWD